MWGSCIIFILLSDVYNKGAASLIYNILDKLEDATKLLVDAHNSDFGGPRPPGAPRSQVYSIPVATCFRDLVVHSITKLVTTLLDGGVVFQHAELLPFIAEAILRSNYFAGDGAWARCCLILLTSSFASCSLLCHHCPSFTTCVLLHGLSLLYHIPLTSFCSSCMPLPTENESLSATQQLLNDWTARNQFLGQTGEHPLLPLIWYKSDDKPSRSSGFLPLRHVFSGADLCQAIDLDLTISGNDCRRMLVFEKISVINILTDA